MIVQWLECPKCQRLSARRTSGGERGEAGPFLVCFTDDCDYNEEDAHRNEARIHRIACEAGKAAVEAGRKWPPYNSAHEGYGVLMEEIRELEEHIFTNQKKRDIAAMRAEALDVAACAIRFVADLCNEVDGRK